MIIRGREWDLNPRSRAVLGVLTPPQAHMLTKLCHPQVTALPRPRVQVGFRFRYLDCGARILWVPVTSLGTHLLRFLSVNYLEALRLFCGLVCRVRAVHTLMWQGTFSSMIMWPLGMSISLRRHFQRILDFARIRYSAMFASHIPLKDKLNIN